MQSLIKIAVLAAAVAGSLALGGCGRNGLPVALNAPDASKKTSDAQPARAAAPTQNQTGAQSAGLTSIDPVTGRPIAPGSRVVGLPDAMSRSLKDSAPKQSFVLDPLL